MRCPYCQAEDSKVIDSRASDEGYSIRRRRECLECKRRFTTYERYEERPLMVIKKSGRREPFDRNKLLSGISRACEKRPVSMEAIEGMLNQIERELRDLNEPEVSSKIIGEKVMDALRALDEVAYVRFASVYKQFKDLNSFIITIDQLKKG
ncbi:MAG TPA: transcriptional repressor NrdR [Syntrophomonadaceae bacterium]|nr:transcriptional repressor NrdR [Syntrophomonadaceae bacterium]